MDFYDITQSFATSEATLDYLCVVSLEIETTLLDLEDGLLANDLTIRDCTDKLTRTVDEFDKDRYTRTKELAERHIELLNRKIGLQGSMLSRVQARLQSLMEKEECLQEHLRCFVTHTPKSTD